VNDEYNSRDDDDDDAEISRSDKEVEID